MDRIENGQKPAIEQRDYQRRIIQRAMEAVDQNHQSILIESATGSGKSIMGHLLAEALYERYGWKTGWTTMRRHLLAQAETENARKLGFEHIEYFSLFDKHPPDEIDVLILDEAHHAASETATTVASQTQPKLFVGLTATPFRVDRMKLCFSKTIKDAGIKQLIESGWLSNFRQYQFDDDWTPKTVADVYLRDRDRWGQSVMYFLTLEECYQCAAILRQHGVACDVVHGGSDQDRQIEDFNAGRLSVLLNVVVLTEGFDAPQLQTVFVRPGSKGPTIQMTGRALRKHPSKPHAQVIQNSKTEWPFSKIASAEASFQLEDGQWRQCNRLDGKIVAAHANTLLCLSSTNCTLPHYLQARKSRRRWPRGDFTEQE